VVLLADWTPDFGNMIILSHGMGYFSYYGHTMKALVEQGTRVRKGDAIGLVGSSGISSAPHLHFEIWKDGKPVNPEEILYATQKRSAQ
jgi:murein DD-endopeptidase MepM/ murein hydrolase activator NlpD